MLNIPPPPPDFAAMQDDRPVKIYRRRLPHWRQLGATYAVTYRLADSLPEQVLRMLRAAEHRWRSTGCLPLEIERRRIDWVQDKLDDGCGNCLLSSDQAVKDVRRCLLFKDSRDWHVFAFVVMPNHVHLIAKPLQSKLEDLIGNAKSHSARAILSRAGQPPPLWQDESYDRIVRDGEHLWRCVQYLARNVLRFSASQRDSRLYMRRDWIEAGWNFRFDE